MLGVCRVLIRRNLLVFCDVGQMLFVVLNVDQSIFDLDLALVGIPITRIETQELRFGFLVEITEQLIAVLLRIFP